MNVSKIVTGVFRGQKDCDQRSRPNFKAKLYDNEGNRFYGTRRAFKLSLTKIYHLASVLATVRQLFASETASLLRCRGKKEKNHTTPSPSFVSSAERRNCVRDRRGRDWSSVSSNILVERTRTSRGFKGTILIHLVSFSIDSIGFVYRIQLSDR